MTSQKPASAAQSAGASELLRSLGLLVDGPVRWGEPAPSRSAGVFLVELPGGAAVAPLDHTALRRWLERVPELRLDSQPATPAQLAQRLELFWLPGEPILYVGRAAKQIGGRLAALYQTVLGDAMPHPGGHWLKTLAEPGRLRVWWADTDAYEEYEDALLDAVAARQPAASLRSLPDPSLVLPFANLQDSTGRTKPHGLQNSLRSIDDHAPRIGRSAIPAPARRPAPRRSGGPAARPQQSRSPKRAAVAKPAPEPTYLSADGLRRLQEELDELRNGVRPGVIARVKAARELGDLRENSEYESARKEQSFVEGRIQTLEAMIKATVVIDAEPSTETVAIGSRVTVDADGDEQTFTLVGSAEANPADGRISYSSPVGQALLGRQQGERVTVRLPRGEVHYVVRKIG